MAHHIKSMFENGERRPWWRYLPVRLGTGVLAVLCLALVTVALWLNHAEERRFRQQHTEHAGQACRHGGPCFVAAHAGGRRCGVT